MAGEPKNHGIIKLPPALGMETTDMVKGQVESLVQQGTPMIYLNGSDLTAIDSSGIGFLVKTLKSLKDEGGNMVLGGLTGDVLNLFKQSGLDRIFDLHEGDVTREAAQNIFVENDETRFSISYEFRQGIGILSLRGILGYPSGVRHFKRKVLLSMVDCKNFVINMKDLTYLDSMSVGEIMAMNRILKKSEGSLSICCLNQEVTELFEILQVSKIVKLYATLEDALSASA